MKLFVHDVVLDHIEADPHRMLREEGHTEVVEATAQHDFPSNSTAINAVCKISCRAAMHQSATYAGYGGKLDLSPGHPLLRETTLAGRAKKRRRR